MLIAVIISITIHRFNKHKNIKPGKMKAAEPCKEERSKLKVHMVSETAFVTKGQGVHTAFINLIELLREKDDIEVVINDEGWGDIFHSHTYGPYYFRKAEGIKVAAYIRYM